MEDVAADTVREAFRTTAHCPAEVDHVLPPTGRFRSPAARGVVLAREESAGPPKWLDLLPLTGNPAGATNLLQVATSAALISAGKVDGPGLALSTGIEGTVSVVVLSKSELART